MDQSKSYAICLSGGGARGIAHIGVLQYLHEQGIHPEVVSGTSAGAIIGSMYAAGLSPMEMMDVVKRARMWKVLRFRNPFRGLTDATYLRQILADALGTDDFGQLEKDLTISVVNYNSGDVEYLNKGPLIDVVCAACSVPGIFHSVQMANGDYYVDGGVVDNMPVSPLVGKADCIIGVNLIPVVPRPAKKIKYLGGIALRTFEMIVHANTRPNIPLCNIYIAPEKLADFGMVSIRPADALFNVGYEAARDMMESELANKSV